MNPPTENLSGEVKHVHSVEHSIRWEYAIAGVVALYVASKVLGSDDDGTTETFTMTQTATAEDGQIDIPIGGGGVIGLQDGD
ncbi:hypothetical protein [Halogeometricum rufum]|uniref:hypothetical protein n=1 Tax=Halogeometricum rufum TaxID=553469 RepID=UPI000B7D71E5|nr:hypothetical protein [Halogeometricum rufum]